MNSYEVAVVYHPDLEMDLEKATTKVEKLITDNSGEIKDTAAWGKRKLAYSIKKQEFGIYVIYTVDIPAENVRKLEGSLNITDEVLRYLIVRPDEKKIERAEQERALKAKRERERGEAATETTEASEEKSDE
jgi:small subunit ribosomal protein S6